jgi:hypothetical protein
MRGIAHDRRIVAGPRAKSFHQFSYTKYQKLIL